MPRWRQVSCCSRRSAPVSSLKFEVSSFRQSKRTNVKSHQLGTSNFKLETLKEPLAVFCCLGGDLFCLFFSKILIDPCMSQVNNWGERYGYYEFIDVVRNADGNDLLVSEDTIK